jgi:molecular chaperone HtpG
MVADEITVLSRPAGSEQAWRWNSTGEDGYTITEAEKETVGTEVTVHLKPDTEEEKYGEFLEEYRLRELVKKYSDYIHYPIRMLVTKSRQKPKPEDAPEDYKPEWEDYTEWETLNSMVQIWHRKQDEVSDEEYANFYQDKFGDYTAPLHTLRIAGEGTVSYEALLFIPAHVPFDFYTREYESGLQLYSNGVLIMDKCSELLPEYLRFVRGVVDTPDVSLNISREMLQQTRELKVIARNLDKKLRAELEKLQKENRTLFCPMLPRQHRQQSKK